MTGLTSNLDQIIARFKLIKADVQTVDFSDALLGGVNQAKARMENRIFNQGQDVNNNSLGKYRGRKKRVSKARFEGKKTEFLFGDTTGNNPLNLSQYELKRVEKGRQVRYKDLEFTGALRRGIVVIKETNTSVVCAIPNQELFSIAKAQEEYLKTSIFALSEKEKQEMVTVVTALVKQIYDRLFGTK
jgi:hypothetical protein